MLGAFGLVVRVSCAYGRVGAAELTADIAACGRETAVELGAVQIEVVLDGGVREIERPDVFVWVFAVVVARRGEQTRGQGARVERAVDLRGPEAEPAEHDRSVERDVVEDVTACGVERDCCAAAACGFDHGIGEVDRRDGRIAKVDRAVYVAVRQPNAAREVGSGEWDVSRYSGANNLDGLAGRGARNDDGGELRAAQVLSGPVWCVMIRRGGKGRVEVTARPVRHGSEQRRVSVARSRRHPRFPAG